MESHFFSFQNMDIHNILAEEYHDRKIFKSYRASEHQFYCFCCEVCGLDLGTNTKCCQPKPQYQEYSQTSIIDFVSGIHSAYLSG